MLKRFISCIREYKTATVLSVLFIMFEAIIETLIPFVTANLVNGIKAGISMTNIIYTGLFLMLLAVLALVLGGVAGVTSAKAAAGFAKNVRSDVFKNIQKFSFGNIDKFSSSSLVTRMTTDITYLQTSYMMVIRVAIRAPFLLTFAITMAYIMGGQLALTFVVIVPVLAIGMLIITNKAMPAFRKVFKKYDKMNGAIEENIRAMRVVKGFSREEYEKEKYKNTAEGIRRDFTRAERIVAFNTPLMQFCVYFNMVFVLLVGSKLTITSMGTVVDVGQICAMLTYGMQTLMSLMMLSMIYVMLTMSGESMKRIYEVLKEKPSIKEIENPVKEVKDGSVEFCGVNFKYSEKAKLFALSDINLRIESGMTVGIIGGTGSSKSSLVQLIPRLYDVTEGVVKVGGVDVRNYSLRGLRNSVAMVLQKNILFAGTIKENLRWGNENATDEDIENACRLARADEFINNFPAKYNAVIEQGGANVSGGQKQRLCIARALLKKPKILILDDSTSAVDTKTDAFIREGFKNFIPETTKIIIAQRIASVEDADMIIVMDNGTVANIGTHDELMKCCDIYKEIYDQQTNGGKENE